jgi:flavorubredoxin
MHQEILPGVHWVGVVDWGLRHFHGQELSTHRGSSYNAYLVKDRKTAIVDSVWDPFTEEFLENVREVVDPASIDYIVANHAEVDHSGALPELLRAAPNAELVVSKRGAESIRGHYHADWPMTVVGTGDTVPLGENDLVFVEAPMLHWPDSMFTYLTGRNLLMPNDAFGQHYATAYRFNDEVDRKELFEEALKYYVNILTPFSPMVTKKIDELLGMELAVDMIAPSHGIIWREDPLQIVRAYQRWAEQKPERRAAILFDSMWHATRKMAEAIGHGLAAKGVDNKVLDLSATDRNDTLVEVHRSRLVAVGSPTFNRGVLPTVSPILTELQGLGFKNKVGAAFGSYGWSGEAMSWLQDHLESCGIPLARDGIRCQWQPTAEDIEACTAFGRELADAVIADTEA